MRRERREREKRREWKYFGYLILVSRPLVNVLYTPGENGQSCRKFPLGIVAIDDAQETLLVLDKTDDLNTTFFLDFFPSITFIIGVDKAVQLSTSFDLRNL